MSILLHLLGIFPGGFGGLDISGGDDEEVC